MNRTLLPLLALASFLLASSAHAGQTSVACVGDSITAGVGATRGWDYPSQLRRMLGPEYTVRNFGVSGATLLRHGDRPYAVQRAFKAALAFKPDIVILMLGTNDTKPQNWGPHQGEFDADYRWLAGQLQGTNPAQKLFICRPCPVPGAGNYGINEPVLEREIPMIDAIATSLHLAEIDMHAALEGHPEDLPDRVHPNNTGAALMAKAAYKAITGNEFQGEVPPPVPTPSPSPSPSAP
jgi:lysophospholipase L1-like esterase